MGHYMNVLKETGEQDRFPCIDSSVFPFVWLKKGIGNIKFVIEYTQDDTVQLNQHAIYDKDYGKQIAESILELLANKESVMIEMELSYGSGKYLIDGFKELLPISANFTPTHHYIVCHDHETKPIKIN